MIGKSGAAPERPSIVITYPYPLGMKGGGARTAREIARHLGKAGADVVLLPVSASFKNHYPRPRVADKFLGFDFEEDVAQDSVEVVRVAQHPLHSRLDGRGVRKALADILERRRVDIVLSFHTEAAWLPSLLRRRNVKLGFIAAWQYALGLHPDQRGRLPVPVWKWLNRRLIINPYRQADVIFAISQFTRGELINVVGVDSRRIVVCHLGVDSGFAALPRSAPREIKRFIFFGNINPLKGILDAIQALSQFAQKGFKNWTYRILGQGAHESVRQVAREHGVGDRVEVCDAVGDEGLRRELQQADLAIMPSHYESFGLAIAEAQAAGVPVIAYEVGAVPEVVENGVTGWLAPFREVGRLAQCIEEAVQDPERTHRVGLAGRKRVAEMFTWEKTAATILEASRQ